MIGSQSNEIVYEIVHEHVETREMTSVALDLTGYEFLDKGNFFR